MKLYIAGKWQDRYVIKHLQAYAIHLGHTITCDWTNHDFGKDGVIANQEMLNNIALEDENGVRNCEMFIAIFDNDWHYRGALVEFGMALALNKKICIVGKSENSCIFMNNPTIIKLNNIKEAKALLKIA